MPLLSCCLCKGEASLNRQPHPDEPIYCRHCIVSDPKEARRLGEMASFSNSLDSRIERIHPNVRHEYKSGKENGRQSVYAHVRVRNGRSRKKK